MRNKLEISRESLLKYANSGLTINELARKLKIGDIKLRRFLFHVDEEIRCIFKKNGTRKQGVFINKASEKTIVLDIPRNSQRTLDIIILKACVDAMNDSRGNKAQAGRILKVDPRFIRKRLDAALVNGLIQIL